MWGYKYRLHTRFAWDFTTDPDFSIDEPVAGLFTITLTVILAIIFAVGLVAIGGIVAWNLTHEGSRYIKYEVLRDADGNVIYDDNGNPIIYPSEEGEEWGPPDWWSWVIPIVALGTVVVVSAYAIPRVVKAYRGK